MKRMKLKANLVVVHHRPWVVLRAGARLLLQVVILQCQALWKSFTPRNFWKYLGKERFIVIRIVHVVASTGKGILASELLLYIIATSISAGLYRNIFNLTVQLQKIIAYYHVIHVCVIADYVAYSWFFFS